MRSRVMKLKNYEIESLVNVIVGKVVEKKKELCEEFLKGLKKEKKKEMVEYEKVKKEVMRLGKRMKELEKEMVKGVEGENGIMFMGVVLNCYGDSWNVSNGEFVVNGVSDYEIRGKVKDEVVIGNMEGDVSGRVEEIVKKFL
jgi:hypothetical protein